MEAEDLTDHPYLVCLQQSRSLEMGKEGPGKKDNIARGMSGSFKDLEFDKSEVV